MARAGKSKAFGKNLLLSVAIGTTPIVGCTPVASPEANRSATVQTPVTPEERASFDRASQSGNLNLIQDFVRSYPNSGLVRRLLVNLPPETLSQVDRSALIGVNDRTLKSLPINVRLILGLGAPTSIGGMEGATGASDGYAG